MKKLAVYAKVIQAQAVLANKKDPGKWEIAKISSGWFIVIPKAQRVKGLFDYLF